MSEFPKSHKLTVKANSPEGADILQGFDIQLFLDDKPIHATKLEIIAKAGRAPVLATITVGLSELELPELFGDNINLVARTDAYEDTRLNERINTRKKLESDD